MDLDELDLALLKAMQEDGRASNRELARKTDSTAPTIGRRIARLQSLGILKNWQPIYDSEKFELITMVGNGVISGKSSDKVLARLISKPSVIEAHRLSGNRFTFVMRHERGMDSSPIILEIENMTDWKSLTIEPTIATKESPIRVPSEALSRLRLSCDYCGLPVHNDSHIVKFQGRIHPCCCPICKRELEARFARLTSLRDS